MVTLEREHDKRTRFIIAQTTSKVKRRLPHSVRFAVACARKLHFSDSVSMNIIGSLLETLKTTEYSSI